MVAKRREDHLLGKIGLKKANQLLQTVYLWQVQNKLHYSTTLS